MCRIMEELREETRRETRIETQRREKTNFARRMIKKGSFSFEMISELSGLSVEEVKKLAGRIADKAKA